ncbi:hypothetical protein [Coprococcus sp. AF38-1]|jgi:hypothetical protein|uniref:hypothetical protein n=1 Tax=Coprococcus sp. AF38-1 TaxID=2302943 RepID=UPI0014034C6E|nr:hypothetical protein [Coprococcus sp. AF38-1]
MTKEHYFMNFTKEQLAAKLEELDKKYQRERSCDEILAKKPAQELEKECAIA